MSTTPRSSWSKSFSRCQFLQLLVPVFPCPYEIFGQVLQRNMWASFALQCSMQSSIATMHSSHEPKSGSFRLPLNIAIMPELPLASRRDPSLAPARTRAGRRFAPERILYPIAPPFETRSSACTAPSGGDTGRIAPLARLGLTVRT